MSKGTKDYAKKTTTKRRRSSKSSSPSPVLRLSLMTLVLIAGFIATLFYLSHMSAPQADKPKQVHKRKQTVVAKKHKPRFEFYSILPKDSVEVSRQKKQDKVRTAKQYLLQVAAFKQFAEADRLKAELALLGFTVHLQKVVNKGVRWNRVNLGPYTSLAKAEHDRLRLKTNHYKSILRQIN